jgi:hypothetical protein
MSTTTNNARPTWGEIKTVAKESWASKRAWLIILLFALGFSAWSLFTMARSMGAPTWLAVGASTVFDGAAIVLGDQAHRARLEGDSALAERIVTAALVGCSAWLNWQHAAHVGWGSFGLLPAAAPVVAEVLFELRMKFAHRLHLRAQGLVAPRLIPLGRWSWLVFPTRAWSVVKSQIEGRLDAIEAAATSGELLASGGWSRMEAKAEQVHGAEAAVQVPAEVSAPPRQALPPAAAPLDLSGVFRLTPVSQAVPAVPVAQAPAVAAPVPFLAPAPAPAPAPQRVARAEDDGQEEFFADDDDTEPGESGLSHAQVAANLSDSPAESDSAQGFVPVHRVNGAKRVAAAAGPVARRQARVTARVDEAVRLDGFEEAKRIWSETTLPDGGRLSSRKLAALTGLSQSTAHRAITEAKAEAKKDAAGAAATN